MGYDLRIVDKHGETMKSPIKLPEMGSTYPIGGSEYLEISITSNYASIFQKAFHAYQGIKKLNNMDVLFSIPMLKDAIATLNDDATADYWEPTEGNARKALLDLLWMAALGCDGFWKVE